MIRTEKNIMQIKNVIQNARLELYISKRSFEVSLYDKRILCLRASVNSN